MVVRETWRITDDPATTRPREKVLIAGRSAAEAADIGRDFATRFSRHGFHKATRRWWASDGAYFHRFSVRIARPSWTSLLRPFGNPIPTARPPRWIAALRGSWASAVAPRGDLADAGA